MSWRRQMVAAEAALQAIGHEVDVRKLVENLQPVERTAVAIARALQSARGEMSVLSSTSRRRRCRRRRSSGCSR